MLFLVKGFGMGYREVCCLPQAVREAGKGSPKAYGTLLSLQLVAQCKG